MRNIFIFFIVLFFHQQVGAQDRSNKGKEFWLGYGHSYSFTYDDGPSAPINSQNLTLYISAEQAATVTISVNGTSWSQTVNIPANSVDFSILLPKDGAADCRIKDEGLSGRGIHIVSDVPVVVYAHEYNTQLSGATMLMPVESYGYSYYSVNFTQSQFFMDVYSWFFIVAPEDNTRLEITPSSDTKGGWLAGNTYTVNLNKGEIYNVFGLVTDGYSNDMTGSKVTSIAGADGKCHPVAMYSGASIIRFCPGDGGEIMKQQVFPLSAWGTRYLTWHMLVNATGNISSPFINFYRVLVKDPATVVKRNGVPLTGLIDNRYYEFNSTDGDYIEADNPILVAQYSPNANKCTGNAQTSLGDPEMFFLSPIEQGMRKVTFYSTKNTVITVNYISAIVPSNGINSFRVDGAPLTAANYITHPYNSNYKVVVKRLLGAAGQHSIQCDSAFSSLVYGIGNFESYGYTAGTLINNLNSISSIQNIYNTTNQPNTFTCPNSPFKLTIKLAYRASSIDWQFSKVTGINPAKDTLVSNPVAVDSMLVNGREYFTYTLNSDYTISDTGTFYIPVTYTSSEIDHCSQTENTTVTIEVKKGPVTDFSFIHNGCTKDTAYFNNATIPGEYTIDKYIWYYDDNTIDSSENSSKLFSSTSTTVTYRTIATNGCLKDTTKVITSFAIPFAQAAYDRDICIGDSIHFTNSSSIATGSIVQYNWDFGDGNKITLTSDAPFYHKYSVAGNYRVSLTVISDKGCASDTFFLPVIVLNKPSASFSFTGMPCVDSTIEFTPTTVPALTATSTWFWDFGDGQTLTGTGSAVTNHAYLSAQPNATARFTATTNPGCSSDTVVVPVVINPTPVAGFTTNKTNYCLGENVNFTDNSSTGIVSWSWDFGDGISTAPPPLSRTYVNAGTYNVQLTVVSDKGCASKPFTQPVTINPLPVAGFNIAAGAYCIGKPISFTNASTGNIASWSWDFGNSTSSVAPPAVSTTYTTTGIFNVQLTVTSDKGCVSALYSQPVTIDPTPVAGFIIDAASYCSGKPIQFINNSTGNIVSWLWDFGNGTSNSAPPVTRTFNAGTYKVSLTGTSDKGCVSNTYEQTLTIHPTPQISGGPDIKLQNGSSAIINATADNPALYQYTWSPASHLSSATVLNPVTSTKTTIQYTLQASSGPGNCIAIDSVNVIVFNQLYIPNAFTPNGDGYNDIWNIPALTEFSVVTIYNRWGQVIYQSNGYKKPWDGRFQGQAQPAGAYYYIIQPDTTKPETKSGSVMLVR